MDGIDKTEQFLHGSVKVSGYPGQRMISFYRNFFIQAAFLKMGNRIGQLPGEFFLLPQENSDKNHSAEQKYGKQNRDVHKLTLFCLC